MKKQLYFFTLILMVMLGFYAVYYYSNYRVQNLPIRGAVSEIPKTKLVRTLKKLPKPDSNILYTALSPRRPTSPFYIESGKKSLADTSFANSNIVFRSGIYKDSTYGYIKLSENQNFLDNYQHNTGFKKGNPFIFLHVHIKQIFKENFRYYHQYLPFKDAVVKALTYLPKKPSAEAYNVRFYPEANGYKYLVSLNRKDSSRLVFGIPKKQSALSLRKLYHRAEVQIKDHKGQALSADYQLVLPMMDFQITNSYITELRNKAKSKALGYTKMTVIMNTQYNVLNREEMNKNPPNKLIFNKPFIFYYQQSSFKQAKPLLLSWVANPHLLLAKNR